MDGDPEYAIREKEGKKEFIASANAKEQYTHLIAEIDKLDLLQNGWDYALRDLVDNYNKERMQIARSSASTSSKVDNEKHLDFDDYYDDNDNDYPIKFISGHKCTYWHARFKDEEERKKHEMKWHI